MRMKMALISLIYTVPWLLYSPDLLYSGQLRKLIDFKCETASPNHKKLVVRYYRLE